jgi:catechol 2,3-dioxygenase-like lactoylglutathione lyase family enzyme
MTENSVSERTDDQHYLSPVPMPAEDAAAPGISRQIYGMPTYLSVPTGDLAASTDFWVRGLGFVELFAVPGQVVHLRRWAFQDVLLVPGEPAAVPSAGRIGFSCVLGEIGPTRDRCEQLAPGCTSGPDEKPWNCVELTVVTPERQRVVLTAAHPLDPAGATADYLRDSGFDIPQP